MRGPAAFDVMRMTLLIVPAMVFWSVGATPVIGSFHPGPPSSPPSSTALPGTTILPPISVHDAQRLSTPFGFTTTYLSDVATSGLTPTTGYARCFSVSLSVTLPIALQKVNVSTNPLVNWANPAQIPDGADHLPALSAWTWQVVNARGLDDTSNWSLDPASGNLYRLSSWTNHTYYFSGRVNETVNVTVTPNSPDGTKATGGGYVLNAAGYPSYIPPISGYSTMAQSLRPSVIRLPLIGFTGWNKSNNQPILSFTAFDTLYNFANATHAQVLFSLPAGNWGDGNNAPSGTPLYTTTPIGFHGLSGYFMTRGAEYALLRQLINHTRAAGETVAYWDIGNEVPFNSTTQAVVFAKVVQGAVDAVAAAGVPGLVGTDAGLIVAYLPVIGAHTTGVGFLSFHYYPAAGQCFNASGRYCAPSGGQNGTTTSTVFSLPSYGRYARQYGPMAAQSAWYNATGDWVPIINDETNLNSYGGGPLTIKNGTDPRMSDLVGAAWLGALLEDSSVQNVSALTYFSLTSNANISNTPTYAYGGFGFGLTNVSLATNQIHYFAPYFVMQMWDQFFPAGSSGVTVTSSDPSAIQAYAVSIAGRIHVALVDKIGVPIGVRMYVPGHYTAAPISLLDSNSYLEQPVGASGDMSIIRAGTGIMSPDMSGWFTMSSYGFAVLQYQPLFGF